MVKNLFKMLKNLQQALKTTGKRANSKATEAAGI